MNIDILVKQSKFNRDINTIIDIIAPIICDKKITKREIDKANKAIFDKFGGYGENNFPLYSIWKASDSGDVTICTADRYINIAEYNTIYMPEYSKKIYFGYNQFSITTEELNRFKNSDKYIPTRKQIEASFKKYEELNTKIRELENKRNELPFHYYFK